MTPLYQNQTETLPAASGTLTYARSMPSSTRRPDERVSPRWRLKVPRPHGLDLPTEVLASGSPSVLKDGATELGHSAHDS